MPTGLYDIRDKAEVFHPEEIEAGRQQCIAANTQYIADVLTGAAIPLATFVETLSKRWRRAVETSRQIDAMRAGYCSVEPITAPPRSDARH